MCQGIQRKEGGRVDVTMWVGGKEVWLDILTYLASIFENPKSISQPSHTLPSSEHSSFQSIGNWLVGAQLIGNCR